MDEHTLLTIFVGISAVALLIQMGTLFALYKVASTLQGKVTEMLPKVNGLIDSTKSVVDENRAKISSVTDKANDIMDSTKAQVARMEELVTDATSRAKVQMERVEMVLDDTMSRAHETVATVHSGIMKPIREVNGFAAGIKAALNHISRGSRPSVAQVTSDEEMFI